MQRLICLDEAGSQASKEGNFQTTSRTGQHQRKCLRCGSVVWRAVSAFQWADVQCPVNDQLQNSRSNLGMGDIHRSMYQLQVGTRTVTRGRGRQLSLKTADGQRLLSIPCILAEVIEPGGISVLVLQRPIYFSAALGHLVLHPTVFCCARKLQVRRHEG